MIRRDLSRVAGFLLLVLFASAPASAQVEAVLNVDENRLRGTNVDGYLLLFAPDPVIRGSSISHWDTSAFPSLLMEPAITPDLGFLELDVTPALMQDIGWTLGTSNFEVVGNDPGFQDPTPFPGAPMNPATTLGEARANLVNAVLAAWENTLASPVDIEVEIVWDSLFCDPAGAALAGARSILIFEDPGFPEPDTWYPSALTEALTGQNESADTADIFVVINSDIDNECLGPGVTFYYGIDGQNPPNQIDLAPVILHELGHGLGFANFSIEEDGILVDGLPSIYDRFTFDTTTGQTWAEMTDAGRVASAVNTRRVVWKGEQATAAAPEFLAKGVAELTITAPAEVAGMYEIGVADFGPPLTAAGVAGELACMSDGTQLGADDTTRNGCSAATNPQEIDGKIALIDRGLCNFTDKVLNAQAAGAVAAIIVNNAGDAPIGLGGDAALPISIPAVGLGQSDGDRLREVACADDTLLLNGSRFQVEALFTTAAGETGEGQGTALTDDTGYFFFFSPDNVELVVKVLDACDLAGFNSFWVFAAGLTDVEVTLTVTDTQTGAMKEYTNPLGQPFQPIQDTSAFSTCP